MLETARRESYLAPLRTARLVADFEAKTEFYGSGGSRVLFSIQVCICIGSGISPRSGQLSLQYSIGVLGSAALKPAMTRECIRGSDPPDLKRYSQVVRCWRMPVTGLTCRMRYVDIQKWPLLLSRPVPVRL